MNLKNKTFETKKVSDCKICTVMGEIEVLYTKHVVDTLRISNQLYALIKNKKNSTELVKITML